MTNKMKNLNQIETEKRNLIAYDRLAYKGNEVSFNGKTLLSETFIDCVKGEHTVSAIICEHLFRGKSKEDILNSEEFAFLCKEYFRPNVEWFFVLGGREKLNG